ncbi:MAG: cupin domain-containing protein [Planctomycetota bacterium]|jgi:mannose-6-phosphate isomerase-like protein (cupin superfamily)|nr:cupin domain-containing protein [Planctomycetota bacterium]MDP7130632.1 cupin domain-containing protein [Planctomycetota bacterium]
MKIGLDECVIRLGKGERISENLADHLETVNIAGIHGFTVPPERPTEMHYHDFDEYWLFTGGETVVTLRLEDGTTREVEVEPGMLIVTPSGVEHGHQPRTEVQGIEWTSVIRPDARRGHLVRNS